MVTSPANGAVLEDLVVANRVAAHQGLVDGYGHLSARDPSDSGHYLMAREVAPGLVTESDIETYDLESNPLVAPAAGHYRERFIHGEIYKARADVMAVVHSHALPLIQFSVVDAPLRPVFHMAAFIYTGVPIFEIRDHGGVTDLLVKSAPLGAALARTLDDKRAVLMRGHGATIVGTTVKQAVLRAIYTMQNAQLQAGAVSLGGAKFLADDEAAAIDASFTRHDRAWRFWRAQAGV